MELAVHAGPPALAQPLRVRAVGQGDGSRRRRPRRATRHSPPDLSPRPPPPREHPPARPATTGLPKRAASRYTMPKPSAVRPTAAARHEEHFAAPEEPKQIRALQQAGDHHGVLHRRCRGAERALVTGAGDDQPGVRDLPADRLHGGDSSVESLVDLREPAHHEQHARARPHQPVAQERSPHSSARSLRAPHRWPGGSPGAWIPGFRNARRPRGWCGSRCKPRPPRAGERAAGGEAESGKARGRGAAGSALPRAPGPRKGHRADATPASPPRPRAGRARRRRARAIARVAPDTMPVARAPPPGAGARSRP